MRERPHRQHRASQVNRQSDNAQRGSIKTPKAKKVRPELHSWQALRWPAAEQWI